MKTRILIALLVIVTCFAFGQECTTPYNPYEENENGEVIMTSCQSCQLTTSKVTVLPKEFRGLTNNHELKELMISGSTIVWISENDFNFWHPTIIAKEIIYENGEFSFGREGNAWIAIVGTQIWSGLGLFILIWFFIIITNFTSSEDRGIRETMFAIIIIYSVVSFVFLDFHFFDYINCINLIVVSVAIIGAFSSVIEEKRVTQVSAGGADTW